MGATTEVIRSGAEIPLRSPAISTSRNIDRKNSVETITIKIDPTRQNEWVETSLGWFMFGGFMYRGAGDYLRFANIWYGKEKPTKDAPARVESIKLEDNGIGRYELGRVKPWIDEPKYVHLEKREVVIDTNYDSSKPLVMGDT